MSSITGVAHVELSVSNLDASVAWYAQLLGARDVFRATNDHEGFAACALLEPASGMILAFTEHQRLEGGPFTPRRVGLDHLSFAVASEEHLRAWLSRLASLGVANSGIEDYGYALAITFADPDGIALELLYSRPRGG